MNFEEYLPLAPVLLTGLFAFAGTWAGSRFSHANEHNQWLRNEKMLACTEFLTTVERLVDQDLRRGHPRSLAEAVRDAHQLSHARLTLVSPLDVAAAALKLRESVVDLATLIAEKPKGSEDAVWDEQISKAFKRAQSMKTQFILESSKDLNSGIFKGLGPFRSVAMHLLRLRLRVTQRKLA